LRDLYGFSPELYDVFDNVEEIIGEFEIEYAIEDHEIRKPKMHLKSQLFASRMAWDGLMSAPELADFARSGLEQRAFMLQERTLETDVREYWEGLRGVGMHTIEGIRARATTEEISRAIGIMIVGSANQDYRSMLMDGEAMFAISGRAVIEGVFDFIFLTGASTWVDSPEMLEEILPSYSTFKWQIGRVIKESL
jgi:hypothetical protein